MEGAANGVLPLWGSHRSHEFNFLDFAKMDPFQLPPERANYPYC